MRERERQKSPEFSYSAEPAEDVLPATCVNACEYIESELERRGIDETLKEHKSTTFEPDWAILVTEYKYHE